MKTDMNVRIWLITKLCAQNENLTSKMGNLKQQKASVFAPLIWKRWIDAKHRKILLQQLRFRCYLVSKGFADFTSMIVRLENSTG